MDKLKRFIENNREAFDADEMLPSGHLKRFEQKLPVQKSNRISMLMKAGLAIAATVALLLLMTQQSTSSLNDSALKEIMAQNQEFGQEIEELQLYYHMQIGDITEEMKLLYEKNPNTGAKGLWIACQQILADNSRFEKQILPSLSNPDGALFAMTQHYQNSLNGLDIMLHQMKELSNNEYSDNN